MHNQQPNTRRSRLMACAASALALTLAATAAQAEQPARPFHIARQPLATALLQFSRQADIDVVAPADLTRGKSANAVDGAMSPEEALNRLLAGTGLKVTPGANGGLVLAQVDKGPFVESPEASSVAEVVVTGTRIRGVQPSSPTIVLSQETIRAAGLSNVADVVRAIPQNFSGGQNPAIAIGSGGINNQNLTGSSAINLRGLGPDATLTLLNGRRLSYDAFTQAVDVSVIPLAAIQQIQVVTDGASAIYGSDAVAGVANIILKRDFEGLDVSARYGGATDGGDVQTQYAVTGGHTWDTGGFIVAYNYEHDTAIYSDRRDYSRYMPRPYSLLPTMNQQSILASGHQDLAPSVHLSLDALYSDRDTSQVLTEPPLRVVYASHTKEYLLSPTLSFDLPKAWTLSLNALYGKEDSDISQPIFDLDGNLLAPSDGCYCNTVKQVEVDAEGPVASLPGGEARLAAGGGYRINAFDNPNYTSGSRVHGERKSYYLFGELNAPLVGPEQDLPLVRRLVLNGAVRYESYNDIGDVATPKLGVIWSPVDDLDLKASWGKSFKAPTLLQQHQIRYAQLFPAFVFGGSPPPGSTGLLIGGGNPDLKPERATTFTTGFTYRPHFAPGLKLEASYFHINYRDRVVEPIGNLTQAFGDPALGGFITYNPSPALQAATLDGVDRFFDFVGGYDPKVVYALIDDTYTNVARQVLDGVDLSGDYVRPFGGGDLTLTGAASWLNGRQVIVPGEPDTPMTGVIYNPPHFRARAGLIWTREGLTLSGFVNHQRGLTNNLVPSLDRIDGQTTVDVAALYRTGEAPGLARNVTISLSVQNLFDKAPAYVAPLADYLVSYDSTNYSPVGRFVSLTVSKHW